MVRLQGPEGQWKHVIHQALRDMVLQEKSWLNRKDMQGLWTTASLDFEATTRLLRGSEEALNTTHKGKLKVSFKPVLTAFEITHLRVLLSGGCSPVT